ncbi:ferritin family protein [Spirochaetota bacterium]
MANILNIATIVDMGLEKEKARRDFYGKVAETFEGDLMKSLFSNLRDWEDEHINKFTDIRSKIDEFAPAEIYPGEYEAYMQSIVGEKLYDEVNAENFAETVKTPSEAVNWGISFEKDAVLFFSDLLEYLKGEGQEIIKKLINEEKKHIVFLVDLKKKLLE